nr:reverse transcriptase domain-containing protein [Tanacetum cinerariifolium]
MTTHNVGRRTTTTRGGRTGGQTGRGGGRTSEKGGRGNGVNGGVDEVPDFATVIAQNVNVGNGRNGCSYMEFVACNPKEFDGKGGVIAYTPWVEKMEAIQDISGCGVNQKVKLVPHLVMLETKRIERYIYGLASQIRRMVAANEPPTIQHVILKAKVLTNEAIRNGSLKKSGEKRGNGGESSKEGNVKCDKKLGREKCLLQSPTLASTKMVNPLNTRNPTAAHGTCYECGTDHYKAAFPRVYGERPEEKVKHLMSAKAVEPKLEDISIVQNFFE